MGKYGGGVRWGEFFSTEKKNEKNLKMWKNVRWGKNVGKYGGGSTVGHVFFVSIFFFKKAETK